MKYRLLYITLTIILIPWLQSCIMESGTCPPDEDVTSVILTISTNTPTTRTNNHTWNDNLDNNSNNDYDTTIGTNYDSRLKESSVRIFIFNATNNTFVGEVEQLKYFTINDNNNLYRFIGSISNEKLQNNTKYKFIVIANCELTETLTTSSATDILNNIAFSISDITYPNGFIPMWGVTTHTYKENQKQELNTIHLLRAIAKIEINLTDPTFILTNVTINRYSSKGFCSPAKWHIAHSTLDLTHENDCFHVPPESMINSSLQFYRESTTKWFAYLPEYDNSNEATINVEVKRIGSDEYYFFNNEKGIKFKQYSQGSTSSETYDIVRNHHYQYNISKIKVEEDSKLTINTSVMPWNLIEKSLDYSDNVSVEDGGHLNWFNAANEEPATITNNIVSMPLDSAGLKCTFGISTPIDATWYAEIIPISGSTKPYIISNISTQGNINGNQSIQNGGTLATGDVTFNHTKPILYTLTIQTTEKHLTLNTTNRAYLRISVKTLSGQIIHVKELTGKSFADYIIEQSF